MSGYGEPWEIVKRTDHFCDIKDTNHEPVVWGDVEREHANRIIACVNACARVGFTREPEGAVRQLVEAAGAALNRIEDAAFKQGLPSDISAAYRTLHDALARFDIESEA